MSCRRRMTAAPLVELRDIRKAFGGVHAVDDVSVDLYPGEVVALLGHNGAGKSTLMKMLSGAYPIDSRRDPHRRRAGHHPHPARRQALGIETIYQTLALADNLDARRQPVPRPRKLTTRWGTLDDHFMEGAGAQGDAPPQPELHQHPRAGASPVGRPAPGRGHLARAVLQRPHPDHGRADRGARPGGDGAGRRPGPAAQGRRHRHLPDQPRHPRRVRPVRPDRRDEERPDRRHRPHGRRHRGRGARHDHRRQAARGKGAGPPADRREAWR